MLGMLSSDPPPTTGARPFLSIPDVIRERIYAYVLTVNVPNSAPWIIPLPSLSHARNKALATLPTPNKPVPLGELTAKKKKDRAKKEATLRARESEVLHNLQPPPASSCLAILATCRTVLLEAFHLWYQHNTLNFARAEDLYMFLRSISTARANEIRSLRLDLPYVEWSHPQAKFALGRLLKLERLIFIGPVGVSGGLHWYNDFGFSLPDIIKNLRGLREIELLACEGQSDRILELIEEFKRRLMRPRLDRRKPPNMVDLFGKMKMGKQTSMREPQGLDEESGYAPDMASMLVKDSETAAEISRSYGMEPS